MIAKLDDFVSILNKTFINPNLLRILSMIYNPEHLNLA